KEMFRGEVDVLVCDGFVGNLILKTGEGISEFLLRLLKREFTRSWITKIAALILKPAFARAMKVVDYAEVGGALLLGVNGVVIIGHGRSNSVAIENAIRLGAEAAVKYAVLAKNTKIIA
ncbi:MAG: phosphate--acyl-ACP acyltransferase, partial [bacterium]